MRSFLSSFGLVFIVACSSGGGANDAGTDASKDVAANDVTQNDAASDASDAGACGAGAATITGTLLGAAMTPKDALSTSDSNGPFFVFTDYANACSLGTNNLKANSSTLLFSLLTGDAAFAAKAYQVPQEVDVAYATWDAQCSSPTGESAFSGTVTITKSDSCGLVGTYDVTFSTDHITGTFTAPKCAAAPADAGNGCK